MLSFRLKFSNEDMIAFFRSHNFTVQEVKFTPDLAIRHNMISDDHLVQCVISPVTKKPIPVSIAFEKVIMKTANDTLIYNTSRDEIMQIFTQKTEDENCNI